MWDASKYVRYYKLYEGRKLSKLAFQTFLDIATFDLMIIEYNHTELINKILEKFKIPQLLPNGKDFSADVKLSTKTENIEFWIKSEYEFYRDKNKITQLNTIFENYLYKFSKIWLEKIPGILDECMVTIKEVREEDKSIIVSTKIEAYIQSKILYGNYSGIFKQMKNRLKTDIQISNPELIKLDDFYALRNIIVHSDGIIDNKFKKRFPDKNYEVGKRISFEPKYIEDIEFFLAEIILRIDEYLLKIFPDFAVENLSELSNISIEYYYT